MIEINLIPDVKRELIKAQRVRSTVIIGSIIVGTVSVAIVVALAVYVFTVQALRSHNDDTSIIEANAKLTNFKDLSKMLTIQNQLTKVTDLNNKKNIDSRIFDLLNVIIPPAPNDVSITSLTVDSDVGLITVEGKAPNSYAAVEVFKKTIEGATIKYTDSNDSKQDVALSSSVNSSSTTYADDASGTKILRFTISFAYAPELFSQQSKSLTIVVPANDNASDSYMGVPKSILDKTTGDQ